MALRYEIKLKFSPTYPNTPMRKAIGAEYQEAAGELTASIHEIPDAWFTRMEHSYGAIAHGMPKDKKHYMHIHTFYMHPMVWEYQKLATPGELDAFKGKGKWMMCNTVSRVLSEYGLEPSELGITLEASGGDCRFEDVPEFSEYSDLAILEFFRKYFKRDYEDIKARIAEDEEGAREILTTELCHAEDNMKLVEYYESYGLVPVYGIRYSGIFMYGDAAGVMRNCANSRVDIEKLPEILYSGHQSFEEEERPMKRRK